MYEHINIYGLKLKNKVLMILKTTGLISLVFLIADFGVPDILYNNYTFYIYAIIFRFIVIFIFTSSSVYNYYRYWSILVLLLTLPTISLGLYIYLDVLGFTWTIIILFLFGVSLRLLYLDSTKNIIDYQKVANRLIDLYPNNIDVYQDKLFQDAIKPPKKKLKQSNNFVIQIFSYIPPWVLFLLPLASAELAVAFLSNEGIATGIMSFILLFSVLVVYASLHSVRYENAFNEAQKILDEKEKKKSA